MFFSVIVPVYNIEHYLRKSLDSLVQQTCTDKEIILIDDGSTDSSGRICEEYAKAYPGITVVYQANQGLAGARNTGLSVATGEWLSFVDGDDWVDSDMLEELQGYILATDADLYRFGYMITDEAEQKLFRTRPKRHTITSFHNEQELFRFYSRNFLSLHTAWQGVYRHSIIREHHLAFVNERKVFSEDTLFNYQYLLHTRRLVALRYMPYHYLRRKGSLCFSITTEQRLLRYVALGEYAYQATAKQGLTYFQENFHKHYFLMLDVVVWNALFVKNIPEKRIRNILDEMWKNDFHRRCIEKIRHDLMGRSTAAGHIPWYDERFGLSENI